MFSRKKTDKKADSEVHVEATSEEAESADELAEKSTAGTSGESVAEPPEESTEKGTEAVAETEDWHDRYLRLAAEFDNFRKRSAREFGDLVVYAERELIGELTEVLDNLERGLNTDHKGESVDEFAKGVALIRDQLWEVLGRRGLVKMETVGNPFDPEAHDALMRTPSEEYNEGIIVQEVSPGYRLREKVLRHAKVIVSQGRAADSAAGDGQTEDGLDAE